MVRRKGRSLRVDIHCHYLNPQAAEKAAPHNPAQYEMQIKFANAFTRETNLKQMRDRAPRLSDIALRLKEMDKAGIDIQAVSPAPPQMYHWAEPGLGQELARMVNERLAEIVAQHPDRFVALGSVPLQDASLAVSELTFLMKNLGFRGVEIGGSVNGKNLTDPSLGLEKFFAKCEELGALVFIHPGGYSNAERLTEHYFNNVIGNPLETTVAVSYLIFDGVMDRHPKLKVVLPHGGGYLAHYWARMDHGWR
ncbi:MAG: amidohydrolase family protein, partial [Betaproteobacteria bacterium]|nr:amidohydrolase family protein [Betaproteobacteria bacterium]